MVKCKRERERGLGNKIERECFGPHKDEYRAGFELGSSEFHYHLTIDKGKEKDNLEAAVWKKPREGKVWGIGDWRMPCHAVLRTRRPERQKGK